MSALALPGRAVLSLQGPDTFAFLDRVVTNRVANWAPGEARYGALLTPQGKVIADFIAVREGDGVWLDVAAGALEALRTRLTQMRLRAKVEIAVPGGLRVGVVEAGAEAGWPDPRALGALPNRAIRADGDWEGEMAAADWRTLSVAAGVAEWGADYGEAEVFPADINMDFLDGVDFRKGCFIGQEVVSRMKRRGTSRRRTLRVVFDGDAPEAGTALLCGGDEVGVLTSRAGMAALARVRIDRLKDGVGLSAGGVCAQLDPPDWLAGERAALAEAGAGG